MKKQATVLPNMNFLVVATISDRENALETVVTLRCDTTSNHATIMVTALLLVSLAVTGVSRVTSQ